MTSSIGMDHSVHRCRSVDRAPVREMQRPDTAPAMVAKLPWVPGEFAKPGAVI
jgi:hypothetical protein